MKRLFWSAVFLGISCLSAGANALHLNPTQPGSNRAMETFGRASMPVGYYEYCKRYEERCSREAEASVVELTRERWDRIVEINSFVNVAVIPATDAEIFGVDEKWEYPTTVGDCEDYALMKRRMLNDEGFPLGSLLMTVGRDAKGGGHAVLTIVTDLGDFVLDNVEQRVLPWREAEITFLKRQAQNDPNAWVSLVDG